MSAPLRREPVGVGEVWEELHTPLLGFILAHVRDRDLAEDLLQDVMMRVHRHADEVHRVAAIDAWVHQIARNAIVDHYRRAVVRRELPSGIEPRSERPEAAAIGGDPSGELAACVRPLLARLSPAHRQALELTELGGLTQTAAAEQLGLSTSGMKSRVQRARAELKDVFVACCDIELDGHARVTGYRPQGDACL